MGRRWKGRKMCDWNRWEGRKWAREREHRDCQRVFIGNFGTCKPLLGHVYNLYEYMNI